MIRNHLKIAWRNILKNKGIFSINIIGLALGIASCLMISLFVFDELSYDRFNEKADQIVRVVFKANINGEEMKEAVTMAPVAQAFKDELPEVVDATRMTNLYNPKISYNNKTFRDTKFAYVDPNFFDVFTLPVVKGKSVDPLGEPNNVVLTESEAKKYFGESNPIGKTLILERDGNIRLKVTAVIKEVPKNSHFHFDMFASMLGYADAQSTSWTNSGFFNYLVLKEGTSVEKTQAKIPALIDKYMGPQIKAEIGIPYSEFKEKNKIGLYLQPLTDIHLRSDFVASSELEQGGDIKYIYIFSAIALFMLLIACINFMNLSTAAASKRAKEVGIRKVLGSGKKQLVHQFLTESFLATLLALILAIGIFALILPSFNVLSGKALILDDLFRREVMFLILGLVLFIPFLAGGYPAFYLSGFGPIQALKNKFASLGSSRGIRSGLVVFQFVVSAGLIVATLIVRKQMDYIQNKNLGYDKEQILVLRDAYLLGNAEESFKNKIENDPRVASITQSSFVPAGDSDNSMSGIYFGERFQRRMFVYNIDKNYIPTMGMKLVAGRNFSDDFGTESSKVIINESAARSLGFGDAAVGKQFLRDTDKGKQSLTVIGVVKDFNFKTLHQNIEPLIMLNNSYGGLVLRAKVSDMSGLIKTLENQWKQYDSGEAFTYSILDDAYNRTYLTEQKMGTILNLFAILTILVACLGLFGLVTYTAELRVKEIGIRKVLGSSVTQIVMLLTKDFLKLVGISFVIAFPLAYYLMEKWLQDFAYRININLWVFVFAAGITVLIACITVGIRGVQAAIANPVESLKSP
jgi:putative ABC transport system permease protein